eukprot:TRINITY_DN16467_c1_g1_i4.p1 TRINITY_DN16467_c1_g1~~TRINITY_DN16467_c1_g1_i4.p1  ORF type:complete len:219 (+),score=25.92 TRINITY_DN16467_c1_g1_i4:3-659(+)
MNLVPVRRMNLVPVSRINLVPVSRMNLVPVNRMILVLVTTSLTFFPVDTYWQKDRASSLHFSRVHKRHAQTVGPIQIPITAEPIDPISVGKDGNCFFRTISCVLLGAEYKHRDLRGILCDFLQSHDSQFFQVTNCRSYVSISGMRKSGVWATEIEIFGAATLLNTPVFVFTIEGSGRQPRWLKYEPLFQISAKLLPTERAIYMVNLHHHFEPVFNVVL